MSANLINRIIIVLSAFGMFVAGVLSFSHIAKKEVPCAADAVVNCAAVVNSPFGSVFGIPVAYLGFGAYLALLGLALYRTKAVGRAWERSAQLSLIITGIGFCAHLFLQVISINIIQQLCAWCLTSAIDMLIAFILHGLLAQAGPPATETRSPKLDYTIATAAVILAIGAFGVTTTQMTKEASYAVKGIELEGHTLEEILPSPAKIRGNADAKVTVIEFADILCPTCRLAAPKMEKIFEQYHGKLRWAYRHFPLFTVPGHETTVEASILAEYAADQNKFWDYLERAVLESNTARVKSVSGLLEIARESGLDITNIREDVLHPENSPYLDRVNDDFNFASQSLKLKGTPTFVLFVEGRQPKALASVSEVEEALKDPEVQRLLK